MLTASARCLKRLSSSAASPSHHSRLVPFSLSWTTTAAAASNPPTHPPLVRRASHHSRSATAPTADGASSANPTDPPFVSVRIRCDSRVADTLSEALICFGASSASMDELDSSESNDETFITSLFVDGQDVQNCILYASQSIGLHDIPHYEAKNGEHYDWLKNVQSRICKTGNPRMFGVLSPLISTYHYVVCTFRKSTLKGEEKVNGLGMVVQDVLLIWVKEIIEHLDLVAHQSWDMG
ncbi:hypothetical protein QJS10_CPB11g01735 [Acorus calamus]|uniref:Uncharacterized protein n=1 Tax=Acorus calamus TaxID=4465 RepID=A0AAV9DV19_ACOCL|nr:hypothetical protein QJS10_CPB11g01735 [Acorus calamus]